MAVSLYRWLDHEFVCEETVQTDDTGHYRFEECLYGVYYVEATYLGTRAHVTKIIQERENTLDDIVLPIMTVTGRVIDEESGEGIPGAEVIICWDEYEIAGLADETGTYVIHPVACLEGGRYTASLRSDEYTADPISFETEELVETVTLPDMLAKKGGDRTALLTCLFEEILPAEGRVSPEAYDHSGSAAMDYFEYDPYYRSLEGIAGAAIEDLDRDGRTDRLLSLGTVDAQGIQAVGEVRFLALTELRSSGAGYIGQTLPLTLPALEEEYKLISQL